MMPLVKGVASTRRQILAYCLVLAPLGVAPAATGLAGPIYATVAGLGGVALIVLAVRLIIVQSPAAALAPSAGGKTTLYTVDPGARPARDLFVLSLIYLFALFAALLVEKLAGVAPLLR
jgi:protoheme IX farnesyltransferase